MELEYNLKVYTADDKEVGHIAKVVIDPEADELTHIVIREGVLHKEERVIEAEEIASANAKRLTLRFPFEELEIQPLFELAEEVPLRETASGESVFTESLGSLHQPPGPEHYITTEVKRAIPENLVVLEEGTPVVSVDGERVGNLERVLTDEGLKQVEYLVISKGWLLQARKKIPMGWISSLGETEIHLSVRSQLVVSLPAFEEDRG